MALFFLVQVTLSQLGQFHEFAQINECNICTFWLTFSEEVQLVLKALLSLIVSAQINFIKTYFVQIILYMLILCDQVLLFLRIHLCFLSRHLNLAGIQIKVFR